MKLKKIDIREIEGFRLGNAEDAEAGTGVTVIISEEGAVAGVDVRGGGPATRETDLLRSENTVDKINAVVLSGGSAFGLEAASGVMRSLALRGAGFRVGDITVPIVTGASLFDLAVGKSDVFPDVRMGQEAVNNAFEGIFDAGNHGAGTGASVGKMLGMDRAMKTGLGTFACGDGLVAVGAIAAVNACADVYNGAGNIIAGLRNQNGSEIMGTVKVLKGMIHPDSEPDLDMSDIKHLAAEEAKKKAESEKGSGNPKDDIAKALMASYQQEQEEQLAMQAAEAEQTEPAEEPEVQPKPPEVPIIPEVPEVIEVAVEDLHEETPSEELTEQSSEVIIQETAEQAEPELVEPADVYVQDEDPVAVFEPVQEPRTEPEPETEPEPVPEPEPEYEPEPQHEAEDAGEAEALADEPQSEEPAAENDPFALSEADKADMGYDIIFNTTISCVITNAIITKSQANKLASILHDAYARAIKPVHTTLDGDTIFVMSTCTQEVNFDAFAALATDVLQYAIIDAAHTAEGAYGLPASRDIIHK